MAPSKGGHESVTASDFQKTSLALLFGGFWLELLLEVWNYCAECCRYVQIQTIGIH